VFGRVIKPDGFLLFVSYYILYVAKNALIEIASKLLYRSNLFVFVYWLS